MRYNVIWSSQFKKDYKLAMKRHYNIEALDEIIVKLSCGEALPPKIKIMN